MRMIISEYTLRPSLRQVAAPVFLRRLAVHSTSDCQNGDQVKRPRSLDETDGVVTNVRDVIIFDEKCVLNVSLHFGSNVRNN